MRIFHDWEFLENGTTIEPISVGMVAEDGRELYCVNEEIGDSGHRSGLHQRICRRQWLMENVVPHLPLVSVDGKRTHAYFPPGQIVGRSFFTLDLDDNRVMPRRMIRNAVREFVLGTPDVELWAWYGAYDHVALAQLWGPMMSLPAGIPMYTNELQQFIEAEQRARRSAGAELLTLPEQTGKAHHALDDARHELEIFRFLSHKEK